MLSLTNISRQLAHNIILEFWLKYMSYIAVAENVKERTGVSEVTSSMSCLYLHEAQKQSCFSKVTGV